MIKFSNLQFSICNFQFAIILLIFFSPLSLYAHSMDVFASVEGKTIQGKAHYHDGTPAKNCAVTAFDPSGKEIGRSKTDQQGKFTLEARFRCDYRLLVDAGDGHGGQYTISASVLPANLPAPGTSAVSQPAKSDHESDHQHLHSSPADAAAADTRLQQTMLAEIHADVDALQEQLNDYEHRLRFRDILGGIGFIVGIVGVACAYYYRGLLQKVRQARQ